MATFAQLLARQKGKQALQTTLSRGMLQSDAADERKKLEDARRDYEIEVEKAASEMKKRAKRRSRRRLASQVIGTGVGLVTGNPLLGAGITGAGSAIGASLVPEYDTFIEATAGEGRFFSSARADFEADIASTNAFISEASEGQNLLDLTNALQDAYTSFTATKTFGKDFDKILKGRQEAALKGDTFGEKLGGRLKGIFNKDSDGKPLQFFKPGSFGENLITGTGGVDERIKARLKQQMQGADIFKSIISGEEYKPEEKVTIPSMTFRSLLEGLNL